MPDLDDILGATHEVYTANLDAWKREERRLFGRDAVLGRGTAEVDLEKFTNEGDPSYKARKAQATYLNFPAIHAKILAGHLGRVAPMPNYGTLGEVRQRGEIAGRPTVAELFHYNCDGVGSDGTQFRAWTTGVQERAIATGHRWVMVEMPKRANAGRPVSAADIIAGQRPFVVEYSPLAVPYWEVTEGRLDWAVVRTKVRKAGALWEPQQVEDGYYLLVRQGYEGLGDEFAGGGWWLYHGDKSAVAGMTGDWSRTKGQIPLFTLVAESSFGTTDLPAVSGSLTMELGQIGVSLMNRISERNWDARDAAKSVKYVLGAEEKAFNLMVEHHKQNSILLPVPGSQTPDGKWLIPSIYDGSSGAVAAEVYATIITGTIAEAHEIMVRQLTSEADSSGRSKEVGFGEATSPLLASLAARRETFENTLIYFAELRAGAENPQGSVVWPTEFELAPVVAKIDQTIERMLKLGARSATLEASLIESAAKDDGVWPEDEETGIRDELTRSIAGAIAGAASEPLVRMTQAGGSLEGAAGLLGIDPAGVTQLVGGPASGSADAALPEAGAVVADPNADPTQDPNAAPSDQPSRAPAIATTDIGSDIATAPPAAAAAPAVDLAPLAQRIDSLAEQVAALVAALARQAAPAPQAPPPPQAPVVFAMPPATQGKSITVTTPDNRTFTVETRPTTENGTTPPNQQ